jgi:hypothetical protein
LNTTRASALFAISSAILAAACNTVDIPFPVLDGAKTRELVVVGYFARGRYLPEDPKCGTTRPDGTELICLDPPPMRLRLHVSETLYGAPPPSSLHVFTTSHYGLHQIDIREEYPYLVLIETDGESHVMPRYQHWGLARDERGQLAIPTWPDGNLPSWLPCDLGGAEQDVGFVEPEPRIRIPLEELDTCPADPLCATGSHVEIRRGYSYVRRGVPIDAVRASLARTRAAKLLFNCDSDVD